MYRRTENPRTFTHSRDGPDLTRDNVRAPVAKHGHGLVQRDPPKIPTTLRVTPRARVVDQNPAHQLRCNTEEVRAILPANVSEIHQAFVGLVNERCRLKGVALPFAPHI